MAVVNMTRGLYLHTDGRYWKEIDISQVKNGDIISIAMSHNRDSGWPEMQKASNYRYKVEVTEVALHIKRDNIIVVSVFKEEFPEVFLLYRLVDIITYNPDQEPEDDCL